MFSLFLCYNKEKTTLKKQTSMKLKKYLLLTLALIQLFGFFSVSNAQTTCDYSATLSATPTTARVTDNVSLKLTVTRSGNLNACGNSVSSSIQYQTSSGSTIKLGGNISADFSSNTSTAFHVINLSSEYSKIRPNLSDPNTIPFSAFYQVIGGNGSTGRSNTTNVILSGSNSSSSGAVTMNISFKPNNTSTFKAGDALQILVQATKSDVDKLNSSITDIFIQPSVNGTNIPGFNVKRSALATTSQYKDTTVTTANNFKDGANNITVKLFESGTSVLLGQASVNIQATGLTSTPPGNQTQTPPGNQIGGNTSSNTFDCKNNFDPKKCIYNPLPEDELTNMFLFIAKGFLIITAIWGVMFIIIGGFRMVMAAGNEEDYIAAKKTITWAILGVVITMLSFSIIAIVQNILSVDVIDTVNEQQK